MSAKSGSGRIRKVTVKSVRTVREDSTPGGAGDESDDASPSSPKKFKAATPGSGFGDDEYYFYPDLKSVRGAFLRGMAFIYLVAFLSLYLQTEGLYGSNGVTPAKSELKLATSNAEQCMSDKRTLLCIIAPQLNLSVHHSMELLGLIGIGLSSLGVMCVNCCVAPVMAFLWLLYFSLYQVGGVFLWFQWDILLLEAGVLAVLVAPWLPSRSSFESKPRDLITMSMVTWLLFRLMFASGVVKLESSCPTWWGLTALNFHFESQCLPTPVSYFAHHMPKWLLSLGVVVTYYIEIVVPFFFFAPTKSLRHYAYWLQIIFQVAIILTGNYNFFNLLTIILCYSLLDPSFFYRGREEPVGFSVGRLVSRALTFTAIGLSFYYTGKYFGLKLNPDYTLASKISFNRVQFDEMISQAVPISVGLGAVSLVLASLRALAASLFDVRGFWNKFCSVSSVLFYGVLCATLFAVTLVPYTTLHKETNASMYPQLRELYSNLSKYHVTGSYGLFRKMTGVDGYRPEVVLEYANDLNGPWKEYEFMYKPGDVTAAPSFLTPHQPRLDWQMWFASLGTYHDNPWLVSLAYRLLQGEPAVQKLLDTGRNPKQAPKYIRASLYQYTFTTPGSGKADWWTRKKSGEYMPIFSVDHPPLVEFIKKLGYLESDLPPQTKPNEFISGILDTIRSVFQSYKPEFVIWSIIIALVVITFTSRLA